jgi:hypothetical protein
MATKRTNKKKLSTGGKVLIAATVIGGAYAAWEYLIKPMINKDEGTPPPMPGTDVSASVSPSLSPGAQINQIVAAVDQVPPNMENSDTNKKLSKGSKGNEVSKAQVNFNDIIDKMRKVYALPFNGAGLFVNIAGSGKISVSRIKQIADLTQLTTDGNFGQKTADVGKVIMGKETFTLDEVRTKKAQLFNAVGL